MKHLFFAIIIFLSACGSSENKTYSSNAPTKKSEGQGAPQFLFTILKDRQPVEENKMTRVAGVMQGKDLSLFLNTNNSPLSMDVKDASEKTFPVIISQSTGEEKRKAYANLIPDQKSKLKVALNVTPDRSLSLN